MSFFILVHNHILWRYVQCNLDLGLDAALDCYYIFPRWCVPVLKRGPQAIFLDLGSIDLCVDLHLVVQIFRQDDIYFAFSQLN